MAALGGGAERPLSLRKRRITDVLACLNCMSNDINVVAWHDGESSQLASLVTFARSDVRWACQRWSSR